MPFEGLIVLDTVNAINGRRIILRVLEVLVLVDALNKRCQIEIILAEQDATGSTVRTRVSPSWVRQ